MGEANGNCLLHLKLMHDSNTKPCQITPTGQQASPITLFLAGGSAGVAFWVGCYPLDAVKTVLQTDSSTVKYRQYRYDDRFV